MQGRMMTDDSYRFGFNGKEKDSDGEWGNQAHYDYGFRIYDPSIARFLSVDPLTSSYPWYTPYQFAGNKPIWAVDLDGLEELLSQEMQYYKSAKPIFWDLPNGFNKGISDQFNSTAESLIHTVTNPKETAAAIWHAVTNPKETLIAVGNSFNNWKSKLQSNDLGQVGEAIGQGYGMAYEAMLSEVAVGEIGLALRTSKIRHTRKLPCGCFTAGTKVKTQKGEKAIEDIDVGDWVWAYDDSTKNIALKEVIYLHKYDRDTIYNVYVSGKVIEATADHPFFVEGKYVDTRNLRKGDKLRLLTGKSVLIDSIKVIEGSYQVYNFTVDEYHTYFVGEDGILVHNDPCDLTFGKNHMEKFSKHAGQIVSAARKNGVDLPSGVKKKETTQDAFKAYMNKVVKEGESYVADYMTLGDVVWSKLGDSIVLSRSGGEFITHLTTGTQQGEKLLKHWEDVISKSTKE